MSPWREVGSLFGDRTTNLPSSSELATTFDGVTNDPYSDSAPASGFGHGARVRSLTERIVRGSNEVPAGAPRPARERIAAKRRRPVDFMRRQGDGKPGAQPGESRISARTRRRWLLR